VESVGIQVNRSIVVHRYISIFRLVFDASSFRYFGMFVRSRGYGPSRVLVRYLYIGEIHSTVPTVQ